jgi:hypothetical protein
MHRHKMLEEKPPGRRKRLFSTGNTAGAVGGGERCGAASKVGWGAVRLGAGKVCAGMGMGHEREVAVHLS